MPIIKDTQVINGQEVTIYIEVDQLPPPPSPYADLRDGTNTEGLGRVMSVARDVFSDGMELARNCATRAVHSINSIDQAIRPDEFEIQMAIKLDAQVGAILAKMGSEAQLQVTMKWMRRDEA